MSAFRDWCGGATEQDSPNPQTPLVSANIGNIRGATALATQFFLAR